MDGPEYLTCRCVTCSGKIEFPAHSIGEKIECPHCKLETTLYKTKGDEQAESLGCKKQKRSLGFVLFMGAIVICCLACYPLLSGMSQAAKRKRLEPFRRDVIAMALAVEKGISEIEFTQRARQLVVQVREQPKLWTQSQREILERFEINSDAVSHFWPKYIQNQWCVEANSEDRYWLQKVGLENDTNVWMAFDPGGSIRAYKTDRRARTDAIIEMLGQNYDNLVNPMVVAELRVKEAQDVLEFVNDQGSRLKEILAEAAKRKNNFCPDFVLHRLLSNVGHDLSLLDESIKSGGN